MKKFILLLILVVLALAVDGTLTYDIFDFRMDTLTTWLGLILFLAILGIISWADSAKKHEKKNTPR